MRLNQLKPASGSKTPRKRLGRGIGSGLGKTSGRGHKGQRARAGGFHKLGFEGGQMPLQRRLPKRGFTSRTAAAGTHAEVRLDALSRAGTDTIDLAVLKRARIVPGYVERVKVIASGEIKAPVYLRGIAVSQGARSAIEAAGGRIEE
jgi:large subunit ribosomal protein L15